MESQTYCRFHRFGDFVAFDFDDTPTIYLTEDMARRVSAKMLELADNIASVKFSESGRTTSKIEA